MDFTGKKDRNKSQNGFRVFQFICDGHRRRIRHRRCGHPRRNRCRLRRCGCRRRNCFLPCCRSRCCRYGCCRKNRCAKMKKLMNPSRSCATTTKSNCRCVRTTSRFPGNIHRCPSRFRPCCRSRCGCCRKSCRDGVQTHCPKNLLHGNIRRPYRLRDDDRRIRGKLPWDVRHCRLRARRRGFRPSPRRACGKCQNHVCTHGV